MAIINNTLTTSPTAIYTSTGQTVVTLMYFCNTDSVNHTINLYLVPNGGSPDTTTIVYKNYSISSSDTLVVDKEKIILSNGDAVYADANANSVINSTVGYIGL
jgi:hypothetical protein